MSLTIPAFVQFQGTLFPLRGLWRSEPPEGDRFVNAEIDWGTLSGPPGVSCVQFQLSGNSPVAFSQIAAISVDNSRSGVDVDFIFPDSGFLLTVPAHNQGVYPVFTNALTFYVNAPGSSVGDVTIAQILNSVPPPVAIQPSSEQQQISITGQNIANGTYPVIGSGINGTLNGFNIPWTAQSGIGSVSISLVDGTGRQLWYGIIYGTTTLQNGTFTQTGLTLRFRNGINLVVGGNTLAGGTVSANLYYSVP